MEIAANHSHNLLICCGKIIFHLVPILISGLIIFAIASNILPAIGILNMMFFRFIDQFSSNNCKDFYLSQRLPDWPLKLYIGEFPACGTLIICNAFRNFLT
jgi:hypothetical protein